MAKYMFNPKTGFLYNSNPILEEQNVKNDMGLVPCEADDARAIDFFARMEKIKQGDVVVEVTLAPTPVDVAVPATPAAPAA
jgi:hypothetical protein